MLPTAHRSPPPSPSPCFTGQVRHSRGICATEQRVAEAAIGHTSPATALDLSLPGGGLLEGRFDQPTEAATPPAVRRHQKEGTAEGYRSQAIASGIPPRTHGLFPAACEVLQQLASDPELVPFEKHLPGARSSYELLPAGGWATGDAAARNGVDLRLFYRGAQEGQPHGTVVAALRLGEGASIGQGFFLSAHGGAVETALDEATAELAKMELYPFCSTVEANFRIRKPIPLHTSLRVKCTITKQKGIRCWVDGSVETQEGVTLATCEAQLVDMTHFI